MSHIPDDYQFCCPDPDCEGPVEFHDQDHHYVYFKCQWCKKIQLEELPDELKRESFMLETPEGNVARVTGKPGMSKKTKQMLRTLIDVAYKTPIGELKKRNKAQ